MTIRLTKLNLDAPTQTWKRSFRSKKEADAFIEGVNFVNDSAISVASNKREGKTWVVRVKDTDYNEDD